MRGCYARLVREWNAAGRAVVIRTRAGAWIVPLVSFRRVACGEEARGAVFGVVGEVGS
ncbi:hypothetical protein [Methanoculleus sp.]|uniref:hypothetical protein n=1 Tax=Methanoculleus sp. TaxID=90427 RepID=UPI0025EEFB90|nr:hypothetical protein [Methanoculleus sp.]